MANNIQSIISNGSESWSNAIHIPRYPSGVKKFLVVGGTFENSLDQIEVTADEFGLYNFTVNALAPQNQFETKHVTVYYDYAGQWTLVQNASRNIMLPVTGAVTPKILVQGFDAINSSDTMDPEFGEAVIAFGANANTVSAYDALTPKKLSSVTLDASAFDYKNPIWFVADKVKQQIHLFNNPNSEQNLIRYRTIAQPFAEAIAYYSPASHRREIVIFSPTGTVTRFDVRMSALPTKNLGYPVVRVVLLKSTGAFDALFAVFDDKGYIHKLDSNLNELSVINDTSYVNCHSSIDARITRGGKLVGNVSSAIPQTEFFYAFAPETTDAYAINFSTNILSRYDLVTGAKFEAGVQDEKLLRYATTFTNPVSTVLLAAGSDTAGRKSFVPRTDPITDLSSPYWSYLSTMSNGATTPLYGYVARPMSTLTHTYLPTYLSVLPSYDVPLGTTVSFSFTVNLENTDEVLPINLPDGITWTAKVGSAEVREVKHGQIVNIEATHPFLTSQPFPFSVGRANSLVEVVPDPYPDEFTFETIYDIPDYSWHTTETKVMTGINERIEFSVLIDGAEDNDRVEVYVNDVLTPAPVFMRNNDRFYLKVHHGYNQTLIRVIAGLYETDFGIYTVSETEFPQVPNRAYAIVGKEYRTPTFLNDGLTALVLTIDSDIGMFVQGTKSITLEVGQSSYITFTPELPDTKYRVEFGSSRYKYTWDIWTHETWLDAQPDPVYSNGHVVKSSSTISFDEIPSDFITDITIPAGTIFEIDGTPIDGEMDSRGVYLDSIHLLDISCDAVMKIESYPAHNQPRVLLCGNAEVSWLHDYAEPFSYGYAFENKPTMTSLNMDTGLLYDVRSYNMEQEALLPLVFNPFARTFDLLKDTLNLFEQNYYPGYAKVYGDIPVISESWKRFALEFNLPTLSAGKEDKVAPFESFMFNESLLYSAKDFGTEFKNGYHDRVSDFGNSYGSSNSNIYIMGDTISGKTVNWNEVSLHDMSDSQTQNLNSVSDSVLVSGEISAAPELRYFDPALPDWINILPAYKGNSALPNYTASEGIAQFESMPIWGEAPEVILNDPNIPEHRYTYNVDSIEAGVPESTLPKEPIRHEMTWNNIRIEVRPIGNPIPRVIQRYRSTSDFSMPEPKYYKISATYELSLIADFMEQNIWYKYGSENRIVSQGNTYEIGMNAESKINLPIARIPTSAYAKTEPEVYKHGTDYQKIDTQIFHSERYDVEKVVHQVILATPDYAPVQIHNNTYDHNRTQITMFVPTVDKGDPDPTKNGYFATELEALQNAVDIWNRTPDEIYGIQQPDGSWTWAIAIPCGEYCGDFGCDVRGYLAGG